MLSIPAHSEWKDYAAWGKKYQSDLVSVRAFGHLTIVVNTRKACEDLFRRQNYSDRPQLEIVNLLGWDWNTALLAVTVFEPSVHAKVKETITMMYDGPERFRDALRHAAGAVAMSVAYGYDVSPLEDKFLAIAEKSVHMLATSTFLAAQAVNAFPKLKHLPEWFPGTQFLAFAKECRNLTAQMRNLPLEFVKRGMDNGTARSSMSSEMLLAHDLKGSEKYKNGIVEDVAGIAFAAGADTTVSALATSILALTMHPSVQRRTQAEIDSVVGRGRLPEYNERGSLPYVTAVCREVLRWNPVAPLGSPRASIRNDAYDAWLIPAGKPLSLISRFHTFTAPARSMMMYNTWAILHDLDTYPDLERFYSERFLNEDGTINDDEVDLTFRYGRRMCSGVHLANMMLWTVIASVLATFSISRTKDKHGENMIYPSMFYILAGS
ncbi:CyP450 monooxygenase [Amylostereum chailletii]|nr:CyP450 monooxygenase [Amylostereum chailletii]